LRASSPIAELRHAVVCARVPHSEGVFRRRDREGLVRVSGTPAPRQVQCRRDVFGLPEGVFTSSTASRCDRPPRPLRRVQRPRQPALPTLPTLQAAWQFFGRRSSPPTSSNGLALDRSEARADLDDPRPCGPGAGRMPSRAGTPARRGSPSGARPNTAALSAWFGRCAMLRSCRRRRRRTGRPMPRATALSSARAKTLGRSAGGKRCNARMCQCSSHRPRLCRRQAAALRPPALRIEYVEYASLANCSLRRPRLAQSIGVAEAGINTACSVRSAACNMPFVPSRGAAEALARLTRARPQGIRLALMIGSGAIGTIYRLHARRSNVAVPPQGNVGTRSAVLLELIQQCRLPTSALASLSGLFSLKVDNRHATVAILPMGPCGSRFRCCRSREPPPPSARSLRARACAPCGCGCVRACVRARRRQHGGAAVDCCVSGCAVAQVWRGAAAAGVARGHRRPAARERAAHARSSAGGDAIRRTAATSELWLRHRRRGYGGCARRACRGADA
jgi:hypothetical protein